MKLLIAIPALNEEESIESVIIRSLEARDRIISGSPVKEVAITVVSDGSTDKTIEIAQRFTDQIRLIIFPENRGYGAAIQAAWRETDAELLAFMDADGTCDPNLFAELCRTLDEDGADIVLGSRINESSEMPWIRRLGNNIFAWMLTLFSSERVRDTASGMRVVRRSSLSRLMPLPDGMHFTPAMSARAILSDDLQISEFDIPYHERAGQSKLRIGRDGLRFLKVILQAALLYRPSRPLGLLGILCLAVASGMMLMPTLYYLEHRSVSEWMIYRFVVSNLAGTSGCLLLLTSYLTRKIVRITLSRQPPPRESDMGDRFFESSLFWITPIGLMLVGGLLVLPSFLELVVTGATYEHWSRFIAMSFLYSVAIMLMGTWVVNYALGLIADRLAYLSTQGARIRKMQ